MRFGDRDIGVTAIVPCLSEEDAIGDVVRDVLRAGVDRIIVVDGGSPDRTVARATEAGAHVIVEARRGYGRACATGVAAAPDTGILVFLDGDGSDDPAMLDAILAPIAKGEADFVMGSRLRGARETGSLGAAQVLAGRVAGLLMRVVYGVRFTDMSPLRAIRAECLAGLGMQETTFGWNLEMQMRVAARGLRIVEIPAGCRRRRGGLSKVSGNAAAIIPATWSIATTFVRLSMMLRR